MTPSSSPATKHCRTLACPPRPDDFAGGPIVAEEAEAARLAVEAGNQQAEHAHRLPAAGAQGGCAAVDSAGASTAVRR